MPAAAAVFKTAAMLYYTDVYNYNAGEYYVPRSLNTHLMRSNN